MSLCLLPAARAYGYAYGEKTDTVDIYVGYFGGPYAYIETVTEDEMQNNCVCGEWTYSSIDNGYYTRYNLAYGVTIDSLLDYCNIVTSDIEEIYFLGTDNDYYAGFHDLFGVQHYYFPYLAENYNQEYPDESNSGLINSRRIDVPAILAFEQSLYRDSGAFDYDKYKAMMDDDECLRIVFGQTRWDEVSTSDSVKWVYEIAVMLKGNPVTVETAETEYGSVVKIYVDSGFEELDKLIRSDLNISTVNENDKDKLEIIEDEDGVITVSALGSNPVDITIEGGSFYSGQSTVNAGDDSKKGGDKPDDRDPDDSDPESDGNTGDTSGQELTPDDDDDYNTENDKNDENDENDKEDDNNNQSLSTNQGDNGGVGSGGSGTGSGGTENGGNGSGSGSAAQGNGAGGMLSTETGGTAGADSGSGDPTSDASGDASLSSAGVNADAQLVPMSAEGEAIFNQIQGYMMEQLDELEDTPSSAQTTLITEEVQRYIEDLIKQFEDEDEPLDMETILEMVRDYIDELVDQLGTEEVSEDNTSESSEAARSVYLSLGNVSGGDTEGGSVTGSGTTGGSGGKMLDIEEVPTYYYVILIVALAALFVGGGMYRSLRFRKDLAR